MPSHRPLKPRARGFTLIEVLVAMLIFSFGMLGVAGLQTRLLTYSQSSFMRSQAVALTNDVLDRMRVDRVNANIGQWDTALTEQGNTISAGVEPYQYDLRDWKLAVETLLPEGRASIVTTRTDTVNAVVTVRIEWNDSRGLDSANTDNGREHFETRSRL